MDTVPHAPNSVLCDTVWSYAGYDMANLIPIIQHAFSILCIDF